MMGMKNKAKTRTREKRGETGEAEGRAGEGQGKREGKRRLFPKELDKVLRDTFRCLGPFPGYLDMLSTSVDLAISDLDDIAIYPAFILLFTSQSVSRSNFTVHIRKRLIERVDVAGATSRSSHFRFLSPFQRYSLEAITDENSEKRLFTTSWPIVLYYILR